MVVPPWLPAEEKRLSSTRRRWAMARSIASAPRGAANDSRRTRAVSTTPWRA